MIYPDLEKKLHHAKTDFEEATSNNIIELGRQYLALLEEYLNKLYEHPGRYAQPAPSSSYESVASLREAIQGAIKHAEQERNMIDVLLDSFEEITFGEAVETLNRQKYEGRDTWKLGATGVKNGLGSTMSVQRAAEIALLLRREEYIARNTAG